jgi:sugar/nucleoside kinase (ribokinase family)
MGVSGDGLIAVDDSSGITVSLSMRDERSFFSHAGANRHLATWLDQPESIDRLATARHVHFALPIAAASAAILFPRLRAAGTTISLDIGHMPDWLGDSANQATLALADYFLPNAAEAALMEATAPPVAGSYLALAHQAGMRHAVVKLGPDGAVHAGPDDSIHVSPPSVDALDTTGAGDAFDAGFIDALLDDASPRDLLRRACIVGALSTRRAGALAALPDKAEMWSIYEQYYGG